MNSAIPIATGTASTIASSEISTVTQSSGSTPKSSVSPPTSQVRAVRKLDRSEVIAGSALITRNAVTSPISSTMNASAPELRAASTRSANRPGPRPPRVPAPNTGSCSTAVLSAAGWLEAMKGSAPRRPGGGADSLGSGTGCSNSETTGSASRAGPVGVGVRSIIASRFGIVGGISDRTC
jgi:hypothetical protein